MEHTLALQEIDPNIKRSTYNKERYEANKDYILKYRKIDNFDFWRENIFLGGKILFWRDNTFFASFRQKQENIIFSVFFSVFQCFSVFFSVSVSVFQCFFSNSLKHL